MAEPPRVDIIMERDSFDHSEEPPEEDSNIQIANSKSKKTKNTVELSRIDISNNSKDEIPTKVDSIANKTKHRQAENMYKDILSPVSRTSGPN